MPYKNPNYCLSEKYFALKAQEAIDAKNRMTEGIFTLLSSAAVDGEVTYADEILDSLGLPSDNTVISDTTNTITFVTPQSSLDPPENPFYT